MTETTSEIFEISSDQSKNVRLTIWSQTGAIFQEKFPVQKTTFAHVKHLAMQVLLRDNDDSNLSIDDNSICHIPLNKLDSYELISIQTRRAVEDQHTLSQEKVNDEGSIIHARKQQI